MKRALFPPDSAAPPGERSTAALSGADMIAPATGGTSTAEAAVTPFNSVLSVTGASLSEQPSEDGKSNRLTSAASGRGREAVTAGICARRADVTAELDCTGCSKSTGSFGLVAMTGADASAGTAFS